MRVALYRTVNYTKRIMISVYRVGNLFEYERVNVERVFKEGYVVDVTYKLSSYTFKTKDNCQDKESLLEGMREHKRFVKSQEFKE